MTKSFLFQRKRAKSERRRSSTADNPDRQQMRSQQPKDKRRRGQWTRLQVEHTVHRNVGENEGKRRQGVLGDIRAHQRAQAS